MDDITTIGIDLAKSVFQLHGVDADQHKVALMISDGRLTLPGRKADRASVAERSRAAVAKFRLAQEKVHGPARACCSKVGTGFELHEHAESTA